MTLVRRKALGGLPYGVTAEGRIGSGGTASGSAGSLWITNLDGPTVWHLDLASGVMSSVDVGHRTLDAETGGGLVWLLGSDGALIAVHPDTGAVQSVQDVGQCPTAETYAYDTLWVVGCDGQLRRIDQHSPPLAPLPPISVGDQLSDITSFDSRLWITDEAGDEAVEVDPNSQQVVDRIPTGDAPLDITAGAGSLWVDNLNSVTITRIDPAR
jgi:streptogramin lyase